MHVLSLTSRRSSAALTAVSTESVKKKLDRKQTFQQQFTILKLLAPTITCLLQTETRNGVLQTGIIRTTDRQSSGLEMDSLQLFLDRFGPSCEAVSQCLNLCHGCFCSAGGSCDVTVVCFFW